MNLINWLGCQGDSAKKSSRPRTNNDYYSPPFGTITKRDRKQKNGSDVGKVYSGGPGSGRHPESAGVAHIEPGSKIETCPHCGSRNVVRNFRMDDSNNKVATRECTECDRTWDKQHSTWVDR